MTTTQPQPLPRRTATLLLAFLAVISVGMLLADTGVAKKKPPFKTGTYTGTSNQVQRNALQLDIKKKKVSVVFFDFYNPACVYPCMQPSWAGISGKIEKKGKKGEFEVPSPGDGYYGYVSGTVKRKKAHGSVYYAPGGYDPDLPPLPFKWSAERTGPSLFRTG